MKGKISKALAVTLVASQMQTIAYAQEIDNIKATDIVNEDVSQKSGISDKDISADAAKEKIIKKEKEVVTNTSNYEPKGKLELDINFSMPIKFVNADETNILVNLKKDNQVIGTVKLGKDNTSGALNSDITYSLEALDFKRAELENDAEELEFYHLTFENLVLGTYSLEVVGEGYETANVDDIEIQTTSKRVLLGTSDKTIVLDDNGTENTDDDIKEVYPGVFLAGNVNNTSLVDESDYSDLKNEIKSGSSNGNAGSKFDLNRDGKVDITDLTYVHQNMNKQKGKAIIEDTDAIINPDNVNIEVQDTVQVTGDIKDILKDNSSSVTLEPKDGSEISEENPISLPMNLAGTTAYANYAKSINVNVEKVVIKAPSENAPGTGNITIPQAGEGGTDLVVKFDETNSKRSKIRTANGNVMDEIVIDLGKQVAVSQITLNVTGGRGNKNLTEISKVEFLNNVYNEIPQPKMNIPVINNFKSTTAVGNESLTVGWDHEANVTGYELKVEELNDNGAVVSTSTYKTSENSLKIEKVKGYSTYRISIQSLSGDEWKSGYKDEQDTYDASVVGGTNLDTNLNDKDGKPDNVDADYNPHGWDSISGILSDKATSSVENQNFFGADSIIEVQVIPETAPEGPEGITIKGEYKGLTVNWKAHKKAKDYDLYYRKVGTGEWIKANDPNEPKYVDSNPDNNIPDGVADLKPEEKKDSDELIRGTSYKITGLEDTATYEIMMTATNHHGTGGLSNVYLGSTAKLVPPVTTNYNLINIPKGSGQLSNHIENIEYIAGKADNPNNILDNDYSTAWTYDNWDTTVYGKSGPIVTFDQEYTMDTVNLITRLDIDSMAYMASIGAWNESTGTWEYKDASIQTNGKVMRLKLSEPITAKKVQVNLSVYPTVGSGKVSISELKFYKYDSLEKDVDNLFADDLKLTIKDDVTQETIDTLIKRAKTIDPVTMEYHPNQEVILEDLKRAQDLYNDINIKDKIISLDSEIRNIGNTIGQSNNWQALGVAVKPGDKVTVYIGSERKDSKFNLAITQHNGESGTYIKTYDQKLTVGKNEIIIPESPFTMDYEKGGNLYLNFDSNYSDNQKVQVRVSGGTEIPHLNVNNMIDDKSKEKEVKEAIRTYIRELKTYVSTLPNRYPSSVTAEDKINNVYTYDPETSILNSTEIEGERITLSLAADQVLKGIQDGISGNEDAQVNRVYNTLLAWEQLMKVSYVQQGLLEKPIDFDGNGKIDNVPLEMLGGKSESQFFNENKAPLNRINIKYQRMFTGAFMYASGHHVGIGYGSIPGMMQGVPFNFDENGNLTNSSEGKLFGWGINHEIGHVHDRPGLTYAETTNNILALISQTFNDINESRIEGAYEKVYDKVTSGSEGLASDGLTRLAMFWQLHLAYDNDYTYTMIDKNTDNNLENDTFYAKLYRATREKGIAPNENGYDQVAQTFIMRASDAIGKDLRPFFAKWGLVASPKTNTYLDGKAYPVEDKAIYYLNDEARRIRLDATKKNSMNSITMAKDLIVKAEFGTDKNGNKIGEKTYLNQKEVPLSLSVNKDSNKILGYEIIRKEATSTGTKEVVVGFVERDKENTVTEYIDILDTVNNRTFQYKVKAYDYNLNVSEVTEIGTIKVNHDGSIAKGSWIFNTNTRSADDVINEDSGHGQVQGGSINNIKDNDSSTVYNASKATNQNGQVVSGDLYVTVDMGQSKSVVGLKYTPGKPSAKKFSIMNFFKKSKETIYEPISKYEVLVSKDGKTWTKAHSGTFDTTKENTIYFNEAGSSDNSQLWAYDAQYVKLVAKGATTISIAELDILGPQGDNIEIGVDNDDKVYENGVGRLKSDYEYAPGKVIPAGSILVTGEYKGDPAFNIPLVLNENNENFALEAQAVLLANIPEGSPLGEVAEGNWLYWITPEQQNKVINGENNIEGKAIKAELYRYNKLDSNNAPVGQRLVSDTFLVDLPSNLDDLPEIDLKGSNARALKSSYDEIFEIDSNIMKSAMENRD